MIRTHTTVPPAGRRCLIQQITRTAAACTSERQSIATNLRKSKRTGICRIMINSRPTIYITPSSDIRGGSVHHHHVIRAAVANPKPCDAGAHASRRPVLVGLALERVQELRLVPAEERMLVDPHASLLLIRTQLMCGATCLQSVSLRSAYMYACMNGTVYYHVLKHTLRCKCCCVAAQHALCWYYRKRCISCVCEQNEV